jgi:DNA-binding response OmpR family regulator
MHTRVLLVDPDDGSRASMALALDRAGLDVVALADSLIALDVLDAQPGGIRRAVVSLRQLPGKPHGIAFAMMMRARGGTARIVLLVDRPDDTKAVTRSDACVFAGILVRGADTATMAAEIVRLFG